MPFTVVIGARWRVQPERLLAAVREGGGEDDENCLELSFRERAVLEASYLRSDEDAVERLARLYLGIVNELEPAYGIAGEVAALQGVLRELVDV